MDDSEYLVGIKSGDYCVVIEYHFNQFTDTWFTECFVPQSDIYPGLMGKESLVTHFQFEVGSGYSFLTKHLEPLNMVLIVSSLTPLTHQNWMHPLMRLMLCIIQSLQGFYTHLVPFLITLDGSLLLASNLINMVPG